MMIPIAMIPVRADGFERTKRNATQSNELSGGTTGTKLQEPFVQRHVHEKKQEAVGQIFHGNCEDPNSKGFGVVVPLAGRGMRKRILMPDSQNREGPESHKKNAEESYG